MAAELAEGVAFIEGEYVPIGEARIPIMDAGFMHSDVTYDVASVWKGKWFRIDDHMARFERSYNALRMQLPHSRDEMKVHITECVRRSGIQDAYCCVIASRGLGRSVSRDPASYRNSFYCFAVPFIWVLPADKYEEGLDAIVSSVRRIPPESVDPTVKNFHWGDLIRAVYEAKDRGAKTAVLVDGQGNVTEGPGYNVCCVVDGKVLSPSRGVLEGITRRTILELCEDNGIAAELCVVSAETFRGADEVFACTTAGGVMPICRLDGRPMSGGKPGPVTNRIHKLFWAAHADAKYAEAIDY